MPRFDRVSPGTPVSQSPARRADWLNAVSESTERYIEREAQGKSQGGRHRLEDSSGRVKVRNNTGGDLVRGQYVQLGARLLDAPDHRHLWFAGETYDETADGRVAVLTTDIVDGEIGPARVLGKCVALVNVTDTSHRSAAPSDGLTKLQSGNSGDVTLLVSPASTGEQEIEVLLGAGEGGGTDIITVLIDWPLAAATRVVPMESVDWDRQSTSTGDLTMPASHTIATGESVDLYWSDANGWREKRTGMTVGTVSGATVPVSGGAGNDLPADATFITVGPYRTRPVRQAAKRTTGSDRRVSENTTQLTAELDVRDNDNDGTLLMDDASHGLLVAEELFLYWSTSGYKRARVTEVDGSNVTFEGVEGDDLPSQGTTGLKVRHYTAVEIVSYWTEDIDATSGRAYDATALVNTAGENELNVWSCARTNSFEHPPIPPI